MDILTVYQNSSLAWLHQTQNATEQRTLAHTVGAKNGDKFTLIGAEGNALEHLMVTIGKMKIFYIHAHRRAPTLVIK